MATTSDRVVFSRDELDLIVEFAGCSLDESSGKNWVEHSGGLPEYICRIARAIKRSGKTTSQAIAIAVSRVKKWAAGADDVDADTRAKAASALAQWEKLKAKNKARKVKATAQGEILMFTSSFNVDSVRRAWKKQTSEWRSKWQAMNPHASYADAPPYSYIREMWSTFLIVEAEGSDELFKVTYEVDDDGAVTFGDPVAVKTEYVVIDTEQQEQAFGTQPTNSELRQLLASVSDVDRVLLSRQPRTALEQVLSAPVAGRSALERVLKAHGG